MYLVLSRGPAGVSVTELDESGEIVRGPDDVVYLAAEVAIRERASAASRWVWDDTSRWYPALLGAGVRVDRCIDLRLCRAILRNSSLTAASARATGARDGWDEPTPEPRRGGAALFEVDEEPDDGAMGEFVRQQAAVAATADPARIGLLLAADACAENRGQPGREFVAAPTFELAEKHRRPHAPDDLIAREVEILDSALREVRAEACAQLRDHMIHVEACGCWVHMVAREAV